MVRDIIQEGDDILRHQMPDVTDPKKIAQVIKDLKETMLDSGAAGFAANQIGERVNICIVAGPPSQSPRKVWHLVNPRIVLREGLQDSWEGCFSIPGYVARIPRSLLVKVATKDGLLTFTGRESWIAQHEIDHLQGILMRDYVEGTHGKKGGQLISATQNNQPVIYRKQREAVRS